MSDKYRSWLYLELTLGDKRRRNVWELFYSIIGCVFLTFLEKLLDSYVSTPIGEWLGLKNIKPSNAKNESIVLRKFRQSFWRCSFHTAESLIGAIVLWKKPWASDISMCWQDFYYQTVTNDVWWYFMLNWSFAWWQMVDICSKPSNKKDAHLMVVHHLLLIILMPLFWSTNLFRIAAVAVFVHNICDVFLQVAKLWNYMGFKLISEILLWIFLILWIVMRMVIYPFWMLYSTVMDTPQAFYSYFFFYIILGIMCTFSIFNAIWTYYIFKTTTLYIVTGKVEDSTSDNEQ